MKVKLIANIGLKDQKLLFAPTREHVRGSEWDLPDDAAESLIARGYAVAVACDEPPAVEKPPEETPPGPIERTAPLAAHFEQPEEITHKPKKRSGGKSRRHSEDSHDG